MYANVMPRTIDTMGCVDARSAENADSPGCIASRSLRDRLLACVCTACGRLAVALMWPEERRVKCRSTGPAFESNRAGFELELELPLFLSLGEEEEDEEEEERRSSGYSLHRYHAVPMVGCPANGNSLSVVKMS